MKSTPHPASIAMNESYQCAAPGWSVSTPSLSGFQGQRLPGSAMSAHVCGLPAMGSAASTARRGTPRMMCTPNFSPSSWTLRASSVKPAPSAALGKRPTAGWGRPLPSRTARETGA